MTAISGYYTFLSRQAAADAKSIMRRGSVLALRRVFLDESVPSARGIWGPQKYGAL
jgi:hypothetical protein